MCVIVGKYFPEHGWVAVKNRDRNYTPEISFHRYHEHSTGIERLLFEDDVTKYCEGINGNGVGILSASLMVQNDEKEITKSDKNKSPDGEKIRRALLKPTAFDAAMECINLKLTGNTIILDKQHLFLLESSINRAGKYRHDLRQIPKDQTVARTNHGVWLPWAGYQRGVDENQTLSRISSEARLAQGQFIVDTAQDPEDMIDGMCTVIIDNPQLNVMRTDTKRKKMRTTAQEMIIPNEQTLFVRPISSHMTFDFWRMNQPGADTWVELLSNRALYMNLRPNQEPPFNTLNNTNTHKVEEQQ